MDDVVSAPEDVPPEPDWEGVEQSYRGRDLTVEQICTIFHISKPRLYARRASENWPKRSEAHKTNEAPVPGPGSSQGSAQNRRPKPLASGSAGALRIWRKGMIVRLYEAMDRQLTEIERQQLENGGLSGAERERQTRQMNVMTRSMEKLAEFHEQEDRRRKESKKANGSKGKKSNRDPETWRLEIARRITRIREKWLAEEAAGGG